MRQVAITGLGVLASTGRGLSRSPLRSAVRNAPSRSTQSSESETSARARGARTLARLAGVSVRTEARPASLLAFPAAAYRAVLDDARAWGKPDLVLAHAPPTVADVDELAALDAAFSIADARTPVRSFKSLIGYALGAAGAIDVALGIHQLAAGEVLANDPAPLERGAARFAASLEPLVCAPSRVLKVAYAQGGIAAALMLGRA